MKIFNFIQNHIYPVLILLITLIFFNKLFLTTGKMLLPGDILGSAYFPKFFFSSFVNAYHHLPLWNPYMFSGMPFLADPSSSMFYPLNLLFLIIPIGYAFSYLFVLDIFLIGLFTYFFAKTIKLDNFSSFISALVFMFSGTVIYRIYAGHLYILDAIVWLPLLFLAFEYILKTKKIIFAILGGIPIALMVFAGHSQFTYYNLLFSLCYFLIRILFIYKENKNIFPILKLIFYVSLSLLIGIGLSAIQLLPSLELSNLSERSNGISFDFANAFYFNPKQLISFILPYFFGSPFTNTFWGIGNFWETCGYLGIAPLLFSAFAIFYKRNMYVLIFLFSAILAILLSFGNYTPLYKLLFNYLPFFDSFRAPARFLYIYSFSVSILCGFGVNFILNYKFNKIGIKRFKKLCISIALILALGVTLIIYFNNQKGLLLYETYVLRHSFAQGINHITLFNQTIEDILRFFLFSFISIISIYLFFTKKIKNNTFKFLIVFTIFVDLLMFNFGAVDLSKTNQQYKIPNVIKKIAKDKSTYRIFTQTGEYSNVALINGQQILTGYNGEYLKSYRDFLWLTGKHEETPYESFIIINTIDNPVILNLLNTKYIVWNKKVNIKDFKFINEYNDNKIKSYLYENTSFFPRAYVVSNDAIKNRKFIVSKNSIDIPDLENKNNLKFLKLDKTDISKEVKINKNLGDEIFLNVDIEKNGYLILSEIWYPGWKVYDNGVQKDILKGDYIFRTVYLEKGKHNIKFIFEPTSYKSGKTISIASIFFTFISILYLLKLKFSYKRKPKLPHLL